MRPYLPLLAVTAGVGLLWGLLALAGQDFWWEYTPQRAWLVVGVYWAGVALALYSGIAALHFLIGSTHRTSIATKGANLVCLGVTGWMVLLLVGDQVQRLKHYYADIALGIEPPADIRFNPDTGRIEIADELRAGSAARFKEVLQAAPQTRVVEVSGPGGLIEEAYWISYQIEQNSMDTLITGRCVSACVDVFAAGQRRVMLASATVGLHSASSSADDAAGIAAENQVFSERLYRIGVEPRFLMIGIETPADGMWINTARQAYLAGLATAVVEQ